MEFYHFCPEFVLNLYFLVTTKKSSSDLESPHFFTFSAKHRKFKIGERNGHGKVMEKYFVKSVGTLAGPGLTTSRALSCLFVVFMIMGDVKINWLQPPYSTASCSQLV